VNWPEEARMPLFQTENFELACGQTLPALEVAYETYGELNSEKSNALLVTHGFTSSHHAAGPPTPDRRKGWWSEVIGPDKIFDTKRYFVISPNALGSCYGSTGPASANPKTGRPYGPAFPEVGFEDIVRSQHLMLRSLGIEKLVAVAGPSIGGFQAFQWAVTFPEFMAGVIAMDTASRDIFDIGAGIPALVDELAADPNWNGGDYYDGPGIGRTLTDIRLRTLKSYGFEDRLGDLESEAERQDFTAAEARAWAEEFDANSLITMHRAVASYDVEPEFGKIRARLLYILADSDEWFPASIGEAVMEKLSQAGVDATFLMIESPYGHYSTTEEPEKWIPTARAFLDSLDTD
jgi:homoserine O-acetyltransferase